MRRLVRFRFLFVGALLLLVSCEARPQEEPVEVAPNALEPAAEPVTEPFVEAVMISAASTQGISFTSPGRVIRQW